MSIDVEFLAQAFKQSPMPAMIVLPDDPIFTIVEANVAYLRATGTSLDDLADDNPEAVISANIWDQAWDSPSRNGLSSGWVVKLKSSLTLAKDQLL